jgi:hypothetical protein
MCAIQNIASEEGYLAPALEDKIKLLKEHARTLPIDAFDNKKRSKFELPPIEEHPGDIAEIINGTGIEDLVKNAIQSKTTVKNSEETSTSIEPAEDTTNDTTEESEGVLPEREL